MMAHKFNKALDVYERLLKEYERLNWKADIAYTLCNIGLIHALYRIFIQYNFFFIQRIK